MDLYGSMAQRPPFQVAVSARICASTMHDCTQATRMTVLEAKGPFHLTKADGSGMNMKRICRLLRREEPSRWGACAARRPPPEFPSWKRELRQRSEREGCRRFEGSRDRRHQSSGDGIRQMNVRRIRGSSHRSRQGLNRTGICSPDRRGRRKRKEPTWLLRPSRSFSSMYATYPSPRSVPQLRRFTQPLLASL